MNVDDFTRKVINFPLRGTKVTPKQILTHCLEDIEEYPQKSCLILLVGEDGVLSVWGNSLAKDDLCRLNAEFDLYVKGELIGSHEDECPEK